MSWAAIAVLDEAVAGPLIWQHLGSIPLLRSKRLCRVTAEEAEALEGSAIDSTQAKE